MLISGQDSLPFKDVSNAFLYREEQVIFITPSSSLSLPLSREAGFQAIYDARDTPEYP